MLKKKCLVRLLGCIFAILLLCGLTLPAKALTDAEMAKEIEAKYKKGEIPRDIYLTLKEQYSVKSGYLKVDMQVQRQWARCVFGPKKATKYPKVPKTISIFMTQEVSSAVKPYVLIKDADGEVFSFLYLITLMHHPKEGKAEVVELKEGDIDTLSENIVNGRIDPPVELFALNFPCRATAAFSLLIGDISFDGQVVEDFREDNEWRAMEVDEEVSLSLKYLKKRTALAASIRPGHPNEWKFPATLTNFIPGGDFEKGSGTPAGWYHGGAAHIPLDENGEPVNNSAKHKANYCWEEEGVQSFRSLSVEVSKAGCWGGWDYQLKGVKPNTVYTISFWYRQPAPGTLKLHLFGQSVMLTNMYQDNPEHWIRYSEHFNSGDCSGEVNVGFHASCLKRPVKAWLDEVELYEGFSPIGYNLCRMQYYYYNHILVSPEVVSQLGFGFEHLFDNPHRPKEIDYILELPEGVNLKGFHAAYYTWLPEHYRLKEEKIQIGGKPYNRYIMTLQIRGDYKTLSHLVKIPKRDKWRGCVGGYAGLKNIHCWLSTTLKGGELKGRYYARWLSPDSGKVEQQAPERLTIKVVQVPEVKFKRFRVWAQTSGADLTTCPELAQAYTRVGVNGLGGHRFGRDSKGVAEEKENLQPTRKLGIRDVYTWFNQPAYLATDDFEAHGMNMRGNRMGAGGHGGGDWQKPGWCLSYRGKKWQERVEYAKKRIEAGVTGFSFDDYSFCNCYCPKCKEAFKKFLQKFTKLPYRDPVEFMAQPGSQPEHETLWKEFSIYHYGLAAKALKSELEKYAQEKNLPYKILFIQSAYGWYEHPFAMAACQEAFDYFSGQYYIHCYHDAYQGSPIRIADEVARRYSTLGKYANNFAPLLAPGLVYMHPACAIDPYEVMKYQILETAFAVPLKGYGVYAGRDTDLGILMNMGAANRIISAYEDIIMEGKVITDGLRTTSSRGSVRVRKLGNKMLILVSDYTTFRKKKTTLKINIPPVQKNSILTDVETGKKLTELAAGQGDFEVVLNANRARVFLCEPK